MKVSADRHGLGNYIHGRNHAQSARYAPQQVKLNKNLNPILHLDQGNENGQKLG